MTKQIAWDDLPAWAQKEIEKAGPNGLVQMNSENGSLSISGGIARYNGVKVAPKGVQVSEEDAREETIAAAALPPWASAKVSTTSRGSQVQMNVGGNVLQIVGGIAHYNGQRVLVSSPEEKTRETPRQNYLARKQELEERAIAKARQISALEAQKKAIERQISQLRTHPLISFNVTDGTDRAWCLRCGIARFVGISGVDFTPANIATYEINVREGSIGNKRFAGPNDAPLEEVRLKPGEIRHCAECGERLEERG